MSTSMSHRRSAPIAAHLSFVAVVLAFVSKAWTADITYNIVNYPVDEAYPYSDTDLQETLSGTIVTNGAMGVLSPSNIVGGSWTISDPAYGSYTQSFTELSPSY